MIDKPYFLYLLSPFRWGRLGSIVNSLGQERKDNFNTRKIVVYDYFPAVMFRMKHRREQWW